MHKMERAIFSFVQIAMITNSQEPLTYACSRTNCCAALRNLPLMRGVMCLSMSKEIEDLRIAFEEYYSTEYSEEDDTFENKEIRKRAVEILTIALRKNDGEDAELVLNLLSKNTGCSEDLIIFEELIAPLVEAKAITQEQIDLVLNAKALARWR